MKLNVDGAEIPLLHEPAQAPAVGVVAVLAPGAGSRMTQRTPARLAVLLQRSGCEVVRFDFAYRVAGRALPDPMPRLMSCYAAVVRWAREQRPGLNLLVAGHSLGGRVASMLAAGGLECSGLLLFAYPLHPAGQTKRLRDGHLGDIRQPVLCFSGTRDKLCDRDCMAAVISRLGAHWRQHWLDGADHSFDVLRRSGRTPQDIDDEIAAATRSWLADLSA